MAANTLLVNGVDIRTQTGVKVYGDMSAILYAPGTLRGQNRVIPGERGQVGVDLPIDAYVGDVTLQVAGATRAAKETNLRGFLWTIRGSSLSSLCTLERRLDNGSGYDAYTAAGQIAGNPVTLLNSQTGRTLLHLVNLDGAWTADSGTTWVIP